MHREVFAHWLELQNCTKLITYDDLKVANASDIWWTINKSELIVLTDLDLRLLTH